MRSRAWAVVLGACFGAALPSIALGQGDYPMGLSTSDQVTVVLFDVNGNPVPNVQMSLSELPDSHVGGHLSGHSPQRNPGFMGSFSPRSCNTGGDGLGCLVTFTSKTIGGRVGVRVGFNGQFLDLQNGVRLSTIGGDDLPTIVGRAPTYDLVGATGAHPDNHYCREYFCQGLVQLADDYNSTWSLILAYNDSALLRGGIFDLNLNFLGPHHTHGEGEAQDVRANGGPNSLPFDPTIRNWFVNRATQIFARAPLHEAGGSGNEHYHIWVP